MCRFIGLERRKKGRMLGLIAHVCVDSRDLKEEKKIVDGRLNVGLS
jgi:hypothetical protein